MSKTVGQGALGRGEAVGALGQVALWVGQAGSPRWTVGAICMVLLVVAATRTGHSVESMDVRTYVQMIRAVSEHGLPYWDNGEFDRFPALVVPWAVPAHGHLWGIYAPLYPYFAAPAFRLGSLEFVSKVTFALLCPLAIAAYALARQLVRNDWYAVLAAGLVAGTTPITAKAVELTGFPLAALMTTVAAYALVRSVDAERPRVASWSSGVAWGAACAAHPVCFPSALAALALMGVAPPAPGSSLGRLRTGVERVVAGVAGLMIALFPVALLNHLRFGTYNPISYGPVPWTGLVDPELRRGVGEQIVYAAPCVVLVLAALGALVAAGRAWPRSLFALTFATLGATILVAISVPLLRERFGRLALVAYGDVVDLTWVPLGAPYQRAADGVGLLFGGAVVKSTLQCTPLAALAPLAACLDARRRWKVLAVLAPCAALYAALVLRANNTFVNAIGWPWLYIRYTFPVVPLLVVAGIAVAEHLRVGPKHIALAAVIAGLIAIVVCAHPEETNLRGRLALVVLPPLTAAAAFLAGAWALGKGRTAWGSRTSIAAAMGVGVAVGGVHDYLANVGVKGGCDELVDRFSRSVPARFALVGVLGQFDVLLSTTATRDVQYADLLRLPGFDGIRPLLDHWRAEQRPVFLLSMEAPPRFWPDVTYSPVAAVDHLYAVRFASESPPPGR